MAVNPLSTPVRPARFFLVTFVLSWVIWIPLTLSKYGIGPIRIAEGTIAIVRLVGVLMPAVCAIVLTGLAGGRPALRALVGRLALWRVSWRWWAAAIVVQPILLLVSAGLYNLLRPAIPITPVPFASIAAFVSTTIALGIASLGEEIGWRGVALPGLQMRQSPLTSSVILGLVWGVWHMPFWILVGSYEQFGLAYFGVNLLGVVPLTIFITWLFNHTRGSILLAVVFHVAFNLVNSAWLPVGTIPAALLIFVALEWVVAFVLASHLQPPSGG